MVTQNIPLLRERDLVNLMMIMNVIKILPQYEQLWPETDNIMKEALSMVRARTFSC